MWRYGNVAIAMAQSGRDPNLGWYLEAIFDTQITSDIFQSWLKAEALSDSSMCTDC